MSDKDKIIGNIKSALKNRALNNFVSPNFTNNIYREKETEDLILSFVQNFKKLNGNFCFCNDEADFLLNLKGFLQSSPGKLWVEDPTLTQLLDVAQIDYVDSSDFKNAATGITLCEALIARTGSILITSKESKGRTLSIFPPIHMVLAYASQIIYSIEDALMYLESKYGKQLPSMISFTSGPSRTADIEKTLVLGAHGPKELMLFLIDDTDAQPNSTT